MSQIHNPAYLCALYNLLINNPASICVTHTFFSHRMTGGSIVGDMAPYQAFAIGGLGSVRGYGEGAVGSGRSCLVANSELTLPFVCNSFTLYMFLRIYYICCIILLAWEVILESVELSSMISYQQILIVLNQ